MGTPRKRRRWQPTCTAPHGLRSSGCPPSHHLRPSGEPEHQRCDTRKDGEEEQGDGRPLGQAAPGRPRETKPKPASWMTVARGSRRHTWTKITDAIARPDRPSQYMLVSGPSRAPGVPSSPAFGRIQPIGRETYRRLGSPVVASLTL